MTQRRAAIVLALALLAGACSSGDGDPDAADCDELAAAMVPAVQQVLDAAEGGTLRLRPSLAEVVRLFRNPATDPEIVGFLVAETSDSELDALALAVAGWAGVTDVRIITADQGLAEARRLFAEEPELLAALGENPQAIGPSLRVDVAAASAAAVDEDLQSTPGVVQTEVIPPESGAEVRTSLAGAGFEAVVTQADTLGCTTDELLDGVAMRAAELEAGGPVGEALLDELVTSR